uniref:Uncharacterized protein n=1 Tax=Arundo donax TaxID=35708 RepID=A0A0A9HPT6_ARUDO
MLNMEQLLLYALTLFFPFTT